MPQTTDVHVSLSDTAIQFMREKIASGEFSSESELLNEGVESLRGRDEERRLFEQNVVIPAYDEMMADPSRGVSIEQVEANLAARRLAREMGK